MADEKGKDKAAEAAPVASGRPETAEELMLRAADLLERRGGVHEKSHRLNAERLRQMVQQAEARR